VDVRRLAPIQGNKEEPIGTRSENRWHCSLILSRRAAFARGKAGSEGHVPQVPSGNRSPQELGPAPAGLRTCRGTASHPPSALSQELAKRGPKAECRGGAPPRLYAALISCHSPTLATVGGRLAVPLPLCRRNSPSAG
jgi:hypothetical protein